MSFVSETIRGSLRKEGPSSGCVLGS
uniref:Uncharacterized protein n=1 Tax=Arundo donax TaxID=35708 RepID=A0A0A9FJB7_ARUDO